MTPDWLRTDQQSLPRHRREALLERCCWEHAQNLRAVVETLGHPNGMWSRERHRYEAAHELGLPDLAGTYKPEAP